MANYKKLETVIREAILSRTVPEGEDRPNKIPGENARKSRRLTQGMKKKDKPTVGEDGKEPITIKPSLDDLREFNEIDDASIEAIYLNENALAKYNPHQLQTFLARITKNPNSKVAQLQAQAVQMELQNRPK